MFHPKAYYFRCGDISHIFITSANLTAAGHFANEEMYCHVEAPKSHEVVAQFGKVREVWWASPFSAEVDAAIVDARVGVEHSKKRLKAAEEVFGKIICDVGRGIRPLA